MFVAFFKRGGGVFCLFFVVVLFCFYFVFVSFSCFLLEAFAFFVNGHGRGYDNTSS